MDRDEALRILGLPACAEIPSREAAGAYWRLRARLDAGLGAEPDAGPDAGLDAEQGGRPEAEQGSSGRDRALAALVALAGEPDLAGLPQSVASQPRSRRRLAAFAAAGLALGMLAVAVRLGGSLRDGSEPASGIDSLPPADAIAPAHLELRIDPHGASGVLVREGEVENVVRADAGLSTLLLEPGSYAVRASHPDCGTGDALSLTLAAGDTRSLELDACPDTGWVVLRSNVADDALSIDGVATGATGEGARALPAGQHALRIERSGYSAWQSTVEVPAGETLRIRAELIAQAGPKRTARSEPAAAAPAGQAEPPRPIVPLPNVASRSARSRDDAPGPETPDLPSERWTQQVREFLLRYDADRSGALDREAELAAVPCDEWLGIQGSHDRSRLALPFTRLYGFDGSAWKGDVLGIDAGLRNVAYARLRECGVR